MYQRQQDTRLWFNSNTSKWYSINSSWTQRKNYNNRKGNVSGKTNALTVKAKVNPQEPTDPKIIGPVYPNAPGATIPSPNEYWTVTFISENTNNIIVNGKAFVSDVKPMIKNNRTMLPVANVARALGLQDGKDILWDAAMKFVTLRRNVLK